MKKAIYFPMNTAHYSSVKSLNIRMNYDFAGYAIYVMCLQKLAEATGRTLPLSDIPALAFDFRCTKDLLEGVVSSGFENDGQNFYSIELNESLGYYDAKYNKASEAGKKGQAQLTPEERKKKAEDAANARWDKLKSIPSDIDLVAQECQGNAKVLASTENNTPKVVLQVNSQECQGNAKVLASDAKVLGITLASDANNRNINRNGNREEIEKEENGKETEREPVNIFV